MPDRAVLFKLNPHFVLCSKMMDPTYDGYSKSKKGTVHRTPRATCRAFCASHYLCRSIMCCVVCLLLYRLEPKKAHWQNIGSCIRNEPPVPCVLLASWVLLAFGNCSLHVAPPPLQRLCCGWTENDRKNKTRKQTHNNIHPDCRKSFTRRTSGCLGACLVVDVIRTFFGCLFLGSRMPLEGWSQLSCFLVWNSVR